MLRFGFVTDIHHGFDQGNKKGAQARRLLGYFFKKTAKYGVDFTADGGDRVIYKSPERDLAHMRELSAIFNAAANGPGGCPVPHHGVNGNHDVGHLTPEDNAQIMNRPDGSYSIDVNGHHIVFWSPNVRIDDRKEMHVSENDINWLRDDLASTALPCVLINHIPLDNLPGETYHDKDDPERWVFPSHYEEGPDIRKILEDSGKVTLCLAGHRHLNRHREINGIHYIVHQSLTQRNPNTGHARGAYSIIEMAGNRIHITGFGKGQPSRVLIASL